MVFSAILSACSGMPYTFSNPGNETSIPTEAGPRVREQRLRAYFIVYTIFLILAVWRDGSLNKGIKNLSDNQLT